MNTTQYQIKVGGFYIHKDGGLYKIYDIVYDTKFNKTTIWYHKLDDGELYVRTEEHFKKSFEPFGCEYCTKRLNLEVYTTIPDEVRKVLSKHNINHVCLAFDFEGTAVIGEFNGIGCEVFENKFKAQKDTK